MHGTMNVKFITSDLTEVYKYKQNFSITSKNWGILAPEEISYAELVRILHFVSMKWSDEIWPAVKLWIIRNVMCYDVPFVVAWFSVVWSGMWHCVLQ